MRLNRISNYVGPVEFDIHWLKIFICMKTQLYVKAQMFGAFSIRAIAN